MANNKPQDSTKDYIWGKRKSKTWIIILIAGVVVAAGIVGYIVFGLNTNQVVNNTTVTDQNTNSGLVRRSIDGVYVTADKSNNYPVAVMIENLVASRPPSGLSKANLVYEALVEGGITRFMAIYAGHETIAEIGPVRSARPYYVDWVLEYNAMYAHAGGSPEALGNIGKYNVLDLSQFRNAPNYWRDSTRPEPHNLYTSSNRLFFGLRDKKITSTPDYTKWLFKDDAQTADRPTITKTIAIDFSSSSYKVEYTYDATRNDYARNLAGQPHLDKDGSAIRAKNVVIQKMKTTLADEQRLAMTTIGQGEAIIFRDGVAVSGRWEKKDRNSRTLFYDDSGKEIAFDAGTTWIEVVPTDRDIVYN